MHARRTSRWLPSLALEGKKTTRVSQETRQRILEIAKQLNYQPNLIARSLVTKKSYTLGLVITTLFNPFYAELSQDIIDRSEEMGYHVFTCSVRGGLQSEQGAVDGLISRGVDGLIISWWGRNSFEDRAMGRILDACQKAGLDATIYYRPSRRQRTPRQPLRT